MKNGFDPLGLLLHSFEINFSLNRTPILCIIVKNCFRLTGNDVISEILRRCMKIFHVTILRFPQSSYPVIIFHKYYCFFLWGNKQVTVFLIGIYFIACIYLIFCVSLCQFSNEELAVQHNKRLGHCDPTVD